MATMSTNYALLSSLICCRGIYEDITCIVCELIDGPNDPSIHDAVRHEMFVQALQRTRRYWENYKLLMTHRSLTEMENLNGIRHSDSKRRVRLALLDCMLFSPSENDDAVITVIKTKRLYEQGELMIPLYLAVWKAQCVRNAPRCGDNISIYDAWVGWVDQGWKANKTADHGKDIALIVSLVRPFVFSDEEIRPAARLLETPILHQLLVHATDPTLPIQRTCCITCKLMYRTECENADRESRHYKCARYLRPIRKFEKMYAIMLHRTTLSEWRELPKITFQAWKDDVHSALLKRMVLKRAGVNGVLEVTRMKKWYEQREQLIPFQLAVWKTIKPTHLPVDWNVMRVIASTVEKFLD
jgi:hypothetical protein